jgi:AraC-like DNA-binding protein
MSLAPGVAAGAVLADTLATRDPKKAAPDTSAAMGADNLAPFIGPLSVAEVSRRNGYASTSQFSRAFRRETGKTPREYRGDQH